MRLFLPKTEVQNQLREVAERKHSLHRNVRKVKQNVHDTVASPEALLSSFAAGAGIGWLVSKPVEKTLEVDVVAVDETDEIADAPGVQKRAVEKTSLLSEINSQLVGIAMSVAMAEVSSRLSKAVKKEHTE